MQSAGLLLFCGCLISRCRTVRSLSPTPDTPAAQPPKSLPKAQDASSADSNPGANGSSKHKDQNDKSQKSDEAAKCYEAPCKLATNEANFLVVGDWGGEDEAPFTSKLQRAVAKRIAQFSNAVAKPTFVVNVGDNFYQNGVKGVDDPRFNNTFESVYSNDVPWYSISGNHDWYGSVKAQIDYTSHSKKWVYPNYFYSFAYTLSDGTTAKFIMLDTQIMCGKTKWDKDPKLRVEIPQGPDPENKQLAQQQEKWLARELRESANAHHLFIVGHYSVYAIGRKKQMPCMKRKLGIRKLAKKRISAYLSAHEHLLQHVVMRSPNQRGKVHYVLSGEASRTDELEHYHDGIPSEGRIYEHGGSHTNRTSGGFVSVHITAARAEFSFIDTDGRDLHRFVIPSRLRKRKSGGGQSSKDEKQPAVRVPHKRNTLPSEIAIVPPKNT